MLAERRAYLERFRADVDAGLARGGDLDDVVGALPPPRAGERRDVRGFNAFAGVATRRPGIPEKAKTLSNEWFSSISTKTLSIGV
jgi:hypothetical protein